MIRQSLRDVLACPKCKGKLDYSEKPETGEEHFICPNCQLAYPVIEGIPVMLIEQAALVEDNDSDGDTLMDS